MIKLVGTVDEVIDRWVDGELDLTDYTIVESGINEDIFGSGF